MAKRESLTRRMLDRKKRKNLRRTPIESLLSDKEFVSSCANMASFIGDTLGATGNPKSSVVLHGIAAAARTNLIPSGEAPNNKTVQQALAQAATEWAAMDREEDPDAYAEKEKQIEILQNIAGASTGVKE